MKWDFSYAGDKPIKGIKGDPFFKFDIDCDLERIDEEICRALATSNLGLIPTVYGEKPPDIETEKDRPPFEDPTLPKIQGMSLQESRKYRIFKREIDIPWTFAIALKPNRFKARDRDLEPWSNVAKRTPYTKHVIENKMPFSEIGRVMIYGSWSGSSVCLPVSLCSIPFTSHRKRTCVKKTDKSYSPFPNLYPSQPTGDLME